MTLSPRALTGADCFARRVRRIASMEFRLGKCSACKAIFRIPASFTANLAKCSKCGAAVEIGPVTSDAAAAAPTSVPAVLAKAISAPVADAAARLAARPQPQAIQPVAAKPAAERAPAEPAKPAVEPKAFPASTKPAVAVRSAPKAATPAAVILNSKRPAAAADAGDDPTARTQRRRQLEKRSGVSPMLVASALLLLGVVGVGVYFAYNFFQQQPSAKHEPKQAGVLAAETSPAEAPASSQPALGFDLSTITDFGPSEGTTAEQWTRLQSLAATYLDFSDAARSSAAGTQLELTPRQSFPAVLNQFKKLKLEQNDGFRAAEMAAQLLERICHGNKVGWKQEHDEDYVQFDQQAIKKWCDLWTKASTDEVAWNNLIRNGAADAKESAGGAAPVKKTGGV